MNDVVDDLVATKTAPRASGGISLAIEDLAHVVAGQSLAHLGQYLTSQEARQVWDTAIEAIPPEHWRDLLTLLKPFSEPLTDGVPVVRPGVETARGIIARGRLEVLLRLISTERLQVLADISSPQNGVVP